jgi:hypothetical protein
MALVFAAALVLSAETAAAQSEAPASDEEGECTASRDPPECAERCPSFDTCYIDAGEGQLYYRVNDQRFDCAGLDCREASASLGDYCCRRGEFAPSRGGGGCSMPSEPPGSMPAHGHGGGYGWLLLGLAFAGSGLRLLRGRSAPVR